MNREARLAVLAVVLLAVAGILFFRHAANSNSGRVQPMKQAQVEKRITDIQNDPHMPDWAKSVAISQIRDHSRKAPAHPQ